MSCENYCPEFHNQNDNDEYDSPDSDYEVQSLPSSDSEDILTEGERVLTEGERCLNEINDACDKEVKKVNKYENDKNFKSINTKGFEKLSNDERILKVAKAVKESGGVSVENILELQQLIRLIMATPNLEGFETYPINETLKLLEMIIYHANCHINSLNI
jgi:hypothetical protein